jgi:hypothetical protein
MLQLPVFCLFQFLLQWRNELLVVASAGAAAGADLGVRFGPYTSSCAWGPNSIHIIMFHLIKFILFFLVLIDKINICSYIIKDSVNFII